MIQVEDSYLHHIYTCKHITGKIKENSINPLETERAEWVPNTFPFRNLASGPFLNHFGFVCISMSFYAVLRDGPPFLLSVLSKIDWRLHLSTL